MEIGYDKSWYDFKVNVLKKMLDGEDLNLIGVDLAEDFASENSEPHTVEWHKCCKKAFKFISRTIELLKS